MAGYPYYLDPAIEEALGVTYQLQTVTQSNRDRAASRGLGIQEIDAYLTYLADVRSRLAPIVALHDAGDFDINVLIAGVSRPNVTIPNFRTLWGQANTDALAIRDHVLAAVPRAVDPANIPLVATGQDADSGATVYRTFTAAQLATFISLLDDLLTTLSSLP